MNGIRHRTKLLRKRCRKIQLIAAFIIGISVMLEGCTRISSAKLIENIPDDAVAIRVVDLKKMIAEIGASAVLTDSATTAYFNRLLELALPAAEPVASIVEKSTVTQAIDISSVIQFTTSLGRDVVVASVNDVDMLRGALAQSNLDLQHSNDMYFVSTDNMVAALDHDKLFWIAPDLMTITKVKSDAARGNISSLKGITQFLEQNNDINIAANCDRSPINLTGSKYKWLCMRLNATHHSIVLTGEVLNRDGRPDSVGNNFTEIDPDFLKYTPDNASLVMAFGKFDGNSRGLSTLLGQFAPVYKQEASGTTALYAVPISNRPIELSGQTPGSWNIATMIQLPANIIAGCLEQYKATTTDAIEILTDSQWVSTPDEQTQLYLGAINGTLHLSLNREIDSTHINNFIDDFAGHRAAFVLNIPPDSPLSRAWNTNVGLTFKLIVDPMQWRARITFQGSNAPALVNLLNVPQIPDLIWLYSNLAGL